jgi:putative addiction module component (TIGR02574 family)
LVRVPEVRYKKPDLLTDGASEVAMGKEVKVLVEAARKLTPDERAELIDELLALDDMTPEVEAAWVAEVQERIASYERGETKAYDADEVMEELRKRKQQRFQ